MIVQTIIGAVLLISAPCPTAPATGCVSLTDDPPTVWVSPSLGKRAQAWVFQHEVGHIADYREYGVPDDELYADRYAACHVPWSPIWMTYRHKHGYLGSKDRIRSECVRWGSR